MFTYFGSRWRRLRFSAKVLFIIVTLLILLAAFVQGYYLYGKDYAFYHWILPVLGLDAFFGLNYAVGIWSERS